MSCEAGSSRPFMQRSLPSVTSKLGFQKCPGHQLIVEDNRNHLHSTNLVHFIYNERLETGFAVSGCLCAYTNPDFVYVLTLHFAFCCAVRDWLSLVPLGAVIGGITYMSYLAFCPCGRVCKVCGLRSLKYLTILQVLSVLTHDALAFFRSTSIIQLRRAMLKLFTPWM